MSDMKSFLIKNGIIATSAGITIGFATATFVKSFVADVILPVIFMILAKGGSLVSKDSSNFFSRFLSKKEFMFANFISETITWILIVLFAFLILDAIYTHYINNEPIISQKMMNVGQELIQSSNPFAPKSSTESFTQEEEMQFASQNIIWGSSSA